MSLKPLKYLKLLILRYQFIGITLSKPHLVCTFYTKQINAKKYEWKFGSVQILMARQCTKSESEKLFTHYTEGVKFHFPTLIRNEKTYFENLINL